MKRRFSGTVLFSFLIFTLGGDLSPRTVPVLFASEVIEETRTQVIVREHPKTGQPYVSIVSADNPDPKDPFTGQRRAYRTVPDDPAADRRLTNRRQKFSRPDYRLLDPKIKAKDIPYEGPYSNRKKVYLFAASIAAVGAAGGIAGLATAPAATGAGASGGAGAYMAGAGAVAGTAAAASVHATTGTKEQNFIHRSESKKEKSSGYLDNPSSGRA